MRDIFTYLLIGLIVIGLLLILIWQNRKDKRKFVDKLNQDYKKYDKHTDDKDPDDLKSD